MNPTPFGQYQPKPTLEKLIQRCRQLPANWWGKQRAQWLRKKVLKSAKIPMDLILDGVALRCYLTDNISERGFVFMPWRFDCDERALLLKYLPADGVFVDVGANVGIYACSALTVLKEKGHVIAIEPNPPVAERLRFNLQATAKYNKSQAKISLLTVGISDKKGTFSLYLNQDNLGASSLKNTSSQAIEIECLPLYDVLEQQHVQHVDVMKVDIEGAEDLALVPFLQQAKDHLLPRILIFEENSSLWQLDLLEALKDRNYYLIQKTRMNFIFTRQPH